MILDSHVHLPSSNHAKENEEAFLRYFPDRRTAVDYLRRTGTGGIIFTTWEGVWSDTEQELDSANAEVLEIQETDPGFFYPGASIHPAFPEASIRWLEIFRKKGLVWVGELVHYRANRGDYDNPAWMKLFEVCRDFSMIVQLHASPSVIRLAKRLPDLKIVNSHIDEKLLPGLAECPNVMLDAWNPPAGNSVPTGFSSAPTSPSTNRKRSFCVPATPSPIRRNGKNFIPKICLLFSLQRERPIHFRENNHARNHCR